MDKKIAALLGAAAALTTVGSVQAATAPAAQLQPATSYRDLLEPVPNAVALLRADDERLARPPMQGVLRLLSITIIIIITTAVITRVLPSSVV